MPFDWRMLLTTLSQAAPVIAQQRAYNRQQQEFMGTRAKAREANRAAQEGIAEQIARVATETPEAERERQLGEYTTALRRTRGRGDPSEAPLVGSDRYTEDRAAASAASRAEAQGLAGNYADIDAANLMRRGQGLSQRRTANDIASLQSALELEDYVARLRASRQRVNPWITLLSGLGTQIGQNYQTKGEEDALLQGLLPGVDTSTFRPHPASYGPPRI